MAGLITVMDTEGFVLPITRKGHFFQDSFFQGFQSDYNSAIGDVLNRFGSRMSLADRFASYRQYRQRDESDESQAASISDAQDSYTIVLDMSAFMNGSISVRSAGRAALVEAEVVSRSYRKSFPLPQEADVETLTAAQSDEGILSITAKKNSQTSKKISIVSSTSASGAPLKSEPPAPTYVSSVQIEVGQDKQASSTKLPVEQQAIAVSSAKVVEQQALAVSSAEVVEQQMQAVKSTSLASAPTGVESNSRVIPLNIEGEIISSISQSEGRIIPTIVEGSMVSSSATSVSSESVLAAGEKPITITIEDVTGSSEAVASQVKSSSTVQSSKEVIIPTVVQSQVSSATQSQSSSQSRVLIPTVEVAQQAVTIKSSSTSSSSGRDRVLPITRKGRFYQDAYFENMWKDFESAIDDLMTKKATSSDSSSLTGGGSSTTSTTTTKTSTTGGLSPNDSRIDSYKKLRQVSIHDESQAATIINEEHQYKIVLDVSEFVESEVHVRALAGQVVVTGSRGLLHFRRRFSLPCLSAPQAVTAAISADGVLTITAPK